MTPVEPREAASVILLRDAPSGIQVWLMERATTLAFAAGMTVFPGGSVAPADDRLVFAEPDADADVDDVPARLKAAALRETFEETGVLLGCGAADLSIHRADVESETLDFPTLLAEHELAPDPLSVRPWARWVTPEDRPRRYDTWFFVARCPDGAQPCGDTFEAVSADWRDPLAALADGEAGRTGVLPPTRAMLKSLTTYATVAELLSDTDARDLRPVRHRVTPPTPTIG